MSTVLTKERIAYSEILSKRLREAMRDAGDLGVMELAEASGVNAMTISRAKNAKGMPLADALVQIADALDVSSDWLMGRTDER